MADLCSDLHSLDSTVPIPTDCSILVSIRSGDTNLNLILLIWSTEKQQIPSRQARYSTFLKQGSTYAVLFYYHSIHICLHYKVVLWHLVRKHINQGGSTYKCWVSHLLVVFSISHYILQLSNSNSQGLSSNDGDLEVSGCNGRGFSTLEGKKWIWPHFFRKEETRYKRNNTTCIYWQIPQHSLIHRCLLTQHGSERRREKRKHF